MRGFVHSLWEAYVITLFIDPGVHTCAWALFEDAVLVAVGFGCYGNSLALGAAIDAYGRPSEVIVERPEYQGARSDAARTQDLLALSWEGAKFAAAYAGRYDATLVERTPGQWKGSEAKPPHHARLWDRCLVPMEKAKLGGEATRKRIMKAAEACALRPGKSGASYYGRGKGSEVHNLLDAVALGCTYHGRFR